MRHFCDLWWTMKRADKKAQRVLREKGELTSEAVVKSKFGVFLWCSGVTEGKLNFVPHGGQLTCYISTCAFLVVCVKRNFSSYVHFLVAHNIPAAFSFFIADVVTFCILLYIQINCTSCITFPVLQNIIFDITFFSNEKRTCLSYLYCVGQPLCPPAWRICLTGWDAAETLHVFSSHSGTCAGEVALPNTCVCAVCIGSGSTVERETDK